MYTKISHGTNFLGAALYNAEGLSKAQKAQKAGKVKLLTTNNLLSEDAPGIAKEMQQVASYSRSQKPVWNVSMSPSQKVKLSPQQWVEGALLNLKIMGIDPEKHQYAIYLHSDTAQDHIHILFNSVPVDGGPAMSRQFNAAKAKNAATLLDKTLGIKPVKGYGIQDQLGFLLSNALAKKATNTDELLSDLAAVGVIIEYKRHTDSRIFGATFQLADKDHESIKGSKLKIDGESAKWNNIAARLDANRAEMEAEIEQFRTEKAEAEKRAEIAEKARIKAEIERDAALKKPPVVVPDQADKEEIKDLKTELNNADELVKQNYDAAIYYQNENTQLKLEKEAALYAREVADKAKWKAEWERDQAKKQPPMEVPDKADKAEIERLKEELQNTKGVANKYFKTAVSYGDRNEALEKENKELKQQLQAQPVLGVEISDRVMKFYAFVGVNGPRRQYHNSHILSFISQAKREGGVGIIANSLAKDFVNFDQAAKQFEKRLNDDYERQSNRSTLTPYDFVRLYRQNPSKEQSKNREITADSAAWQTTLQLSNTFSQPQQEILEMLSLESTSYKAGSLDPKNSRQIKY